MQEMIMETCCTTCAIWFPVPIMLDSSLIKDLAGYPVNCPSCNTAYGLDPDFARWAKIETIQSEFFSRKAHFGYDINKVAE